MKKISTFFALLLLSTSPAHADVVIGETCPTLGTSQMTTDHKDIAVCLEEDGSTDLVWKGSTKSSSGAEGTLCGLAYINRGYATTAHNPVAYGSTSWERMTLIVSIPDGSNFYRSASFLQCQGQDILKQINKNYWQENCPDGYKMISIKNMYSYSHRSGDQTDTFTYQSPILTCVVE